MPKIAKIETFTIDAKTAERIRQSKRFKRPVVIFVAVLVVLLVGAGVSAIVFFMVPWEESIDSFPPVIVEKAAEPQGLAIISSSLAAFWSRSSAFLRAAIVGIPILSILVIIAVVIFMNSRGQVPKMSVV